MPTQNQKQIIALKAEVEHLTARIKYMEMLVQGTQECLDTAAQMNAALIMRAGGSVTLTPADYTASKGLTVKREDSGDDVVLTVGQLVGATN